MRTAFFAVINRRGLLRTTKTDPTRSLKAGEHAIKVNLEVPDRLFKPTMPTAHLTIPSLVDGPDTAPIVSISDVCEGTFYPYGPEEGDDAEYHKCADCGAVNHGPLSGPHFRPEAR